MSTFRKDKTLDHNNTARASSETVILTFTPVPAIKNDPPTL